MRALKRRSKFLFVSQIPACSDGKDPETETNGVGLLGSPNPGLGGGEDGWVTGFSKHSRANFLSTGMPGSPDARAAMQPWSSRALSEGSGAFKAIPCAITFKTLILASKDCDTCKLTCLPFQPPPRLMFIVLEDIHQRGRPSVLDRTIFKHRCLPHNNSCPIYWGHRHP